MKNTRLVVIGILVCMGVCVNSVIRFYDEHVPVALEGHCIQMHVPDITPYAQVNKVLRVMENNIPNGQAVLESPDKYIMTIDYSYQKRYNATRVDCPVEKK